MNVRFFGDSWYWSWYWKEIKSDAVKNKLIHDAGFPALESYLNYLGVNCISYNVPGKSFSTTVETVLSVSKDDSVKYNIVFFSSHLRPCCSDNICTTSFTQFKKDFDSLTKNHLVKLQTWAKENNQEILLFGGQSTIYKHIVDSLTDNSNLHVVCECVISHLIGKKEPFGILKLGTDVIGAIDDTWDHDLVIELYDSIREWESDTQKDKFTLPDQGHLNGSGALLLADIIMEKIEQLNKGELK